MFFILNSLDFHQMRTLKVENGKLHIHMAMLRWMRIPRYIERHQKVKTRLEQRAIHFEEVFDKEYILVIDLPTKFTVTTDSLAQFIEEEVGIRPSLVYEGNADPLVNLDF